MPGAGADKAKGRMKEAGGALSGDRGLKREGKADRASGGAKSGIDSVKEGVENIVGGRGRRRRARRDERL